MVYSHGMVSFLVTSFVTHMPARRKYRSPRRSKSRSTSPRRVLKRRSSGKARRAAVRRSPKRRTYKGSRLYGMQSGQIHLEGRNRPESFDASVENLRTAFQYIVGANDFARRNMSDLVALLNETNIDDLIASLQLPTRYIPWLMTQQPPTFKTHSARNVFRAGLGNFRSRTDTLPREQYLNVWKNMVGTNGNGVGFIPDIWYQVALTDVAMITVDKFDAYSEHRNWKRLLQRSYYTCERLHPDTWIKEWLDHMIPRRIAQKKPVDEKLLLVHMCLHKYAEFLKTQIVTRYVL